MNSSPITARAIAAASSSANPAPPSTATRRPRRRPVGFTLTRPLSRFPREKVRALYADLARQVVDGTLSAPVEKVYPIEEVKAALVHAQRGERSGKILVAPNGPV